MYIYIQELPSLGCPIEHMLIKIWIKIKPNEYTIYTKGCFPMYNGPRDVSGNVNWMSGINPASGISGIGHTNIKKLKFKQCPGFEETLLEESALIYYQMRTLCTP